MPVVPPRYGSQLTDFLEVQKAKSVAGGSTKSVNSTSSCGKAASKNGASTSSSKKSKRRCLVDDDSTSKRSTTTAQDEKRVRFAKRVIGYRAPYKLPRAGSKAEMKLWYTPTEVQTIRKDCISTLRRMAKEEKKRNASTVAASLTAAIADEGQEEGQAPQENVVVRKQVEDDGDSYCTRGLEHQTRQAALRRQEVKRISKRAVFEEQILQCRVGKANSHRLAASYRATTQRSVELAYLRGLEDEREVKRQVLQQLTR